MEKGAVKHRRSIRLPDFDYALPGAYFVTLVTQGRDRLFGEIVNDEMVLNAFGRVVEEEWQKTAILRPEVGLGAFVIMPNHVHGILHILEPSVQSVRAYRDTPLPEPDGCAAHAKGLRSPSRTVGAIVRGFKGAATKRINELRGTPGASLWLRNYYEHIVRTDREYLQVEKYILENPLHWLTDEEHAG